MKQRDLKTAFGVAVLIEAFVGFLTVLSPHLELAFGAIGLFHFIPLVILGTVELATHGRFSTGGQMFYPLLVGLQIVVLTIAIYAFLRVIRPFRERRRPNAK